MVTNLLANVGDVRYVGFDPSVKTLEVSRQVGRKKVVCQDGLVGRKVSATV